MANQTIKESSALKRSSRKGMQTSGTGGGGDGGGNDDDAASVVQWIGPIKPSFYRRSHRKANALISFSITWMT